MSIPKFNVGLKRPNLLQFDGVAAAAAAQPVYAKRAPLPSPSVPPGASKSGQPPTNNTMLLSNNPVYG